MTFGIHLWISNYIRYACAYLRRILHCIIGGAIFLALRRKLILWYCDFKLFINTAHILLHSNAVIWYLDIIISYLTSVLRCFAILVVLWYAYTIYWLLGGIHTSAFEFVLHNILELLNYWNFAFFDLIDYLISCGNVLMYCWWYYYFKAVY